MANKVRWGILSTAGIAVKKVIPAMQKSGWVEVTGIASRDLRKAEEAAHALGIPQAYGSYEELLADPKIEAIYNPLPNHLHVPWSIKAAESGKHVLCEKPVSVTVAEARTLLAVQQRTGVLIAEGFMVRSHPQWVRASELIRAGRVGELSAIQGAFSYFNTDPRNIRNIPACGGGSLMDIGCYPIHISRFLFGEEPVRVLGLIDQDPKLKVDRLTSALMEFPSGQSVFTCSTQLVYHQRLQLLGTLGRIEMVMPFTPPPDLACQILIEDGQRTTTETFPLCNQFTIQGEVFSRAVREGTGVPVPLTDAVKNMAVIEAIFRSAKSGRWETPAP
jgi:predicted dehydrogenase